MAWGVLLEGRRHNQSGCHGKMIIPTPLNILKGPGALGPRGYVDIVELYSGSPSAAATDAPSEKKAEVQETLLETLLRNNWQN